MRETTLVIQEEGAAEEGGPLGGVFRVLRPSYVYLTLASAVVSFALALAVFFVCRYER